MKATTAPATAPKAGSNRLKVPMSQNFAQTSAHDFSPNATAAPIPTSAPMAQPAKSPPANFNIVFILL
jgi:hypothetical protein